MNELYNRQLGGIRASFFNQFEGDRLKKNLWWVRPTLFKNISLMSRGGMGRYFDLSYVIDKKIIFVHIPKAAGRSVQNGLLGGHSVSHCSLNMYRIILGDCFFNSCYKFSFVRNPFDRLLSAYRFLSSGGVSDEDKYNQIKYFDAFPSFENFVENGLNEKVMSSVIHLLPQKNFLTLRSNALGIDFVGRYESFEKDYRALQETLNVDHQKTIPWENKSNNSERYGYRDFYTNSMRCKVEELYKDDLLLLDYRF